MGFFGSVASGAFGLAQTAVQNQFNKEQAERQFGYDKEMAALQNQYNIDMWNMQNAYNSPASQMNRLKEAGLNPNLMYGQGSTGNASSAPTQVAPGQKAPSRQAAPLAALGQAFDALSLMSEIEGYKQKRLETSLLADQERQHFFQANLLEEYYRSRVGYSTYLHELNKQPNTWETTVYGKRNKAQRMYYDRPGWSYHAGDTWDLGFKEAGNAYESMQKNYEDLGYQVDISNYRKQMLFKDLQWYTGNQWFDWITTGLGTVSSLINSVSHFFGKKQPQKGNFHRPIVNNRYYVYH